MYLQNVPVWVRVKEWKKYPLKGIRTPSSTYYIRNDQNLTLDKIRLKYISKGSPRNAVDKSSLVRKALDLLIKKEGI